MKKVVLTMMIAAGSLMFKTASAQVGVSVGFNIGPLSVQIHKPVYDDFYYLPDVEAYYSVPEQVYYYMDGDDWVCNPYLPGAYRNYDWRNVPHYEVRAQRPYMNHDMYRSKFGGYGAGRPDWNRRGNDGGYAYNRPQRMEPRGGNFPHSPYDSNNAGRGYGQPDRQRGGYGARYNNGRGNWNNDNDNRGQGSYNGGQRGNWNRGNNDNRTQGDYNRGQQGNWNQGGNDNRNQGGYNGNQWQNGNNDNRGQGGNYGQPTNQQGHGNRGGDQQRNNNQNDNRQRFPGNRLMF
ncbi:hypothetical protein [Mucilaginibacter lacusdianchii]|uniref:hypothetical protein n=1 Tax=Mucilaginibacter lacusdianchii TaxID=2684211 RepID=UPI00131C470A|nr:hypothetical protein [Mucilaginibacter sp. JXJ CY 39]